MSHRGFRLKLPEVRMTALASRFSCRFHHHSCPAGRLLLDGVPLIIRRFARFAHFRATPDKLWPRELPIPSYA